MKYLIFTLLLILSYSSIKAQLNQSSSKILEIMSNDDKWIFDNSGNDGFGKYISYKSKEKNRTKFFYFKTDSCFVIILKIPNNQLDEVVKDMNSKFTSQGGYIWFDNVAKILYGIVLPDSRSFFEVYQTKSTTMWIR